MKFLAATTMQTECRAMFQAAARRMLVSMASCAVGIIPYHGGYGSQSQHKTLSVSTKCTWFRWVNDPTIILSGTVLVLELRF